MTDRSRSPEPRLSRVEERAARLEERINADRETRSVWDNEIQRRLGELNNHAARQDERDAHYLSKEIYESRHSELAQLLESRWHQAETTIREQAREFSMEQKRLLDELTKEIREHEVEDTRNHREHGEQIVELQQWQANMNGRFWMLGTILSILLTVLTIVLHYVFK